MSIKISFVEQLSKKNLAKMEAGLKEYELSHGIHVDYKPFALELYDKKQELIGVLDAFSSYSSIHIRDLWIDKDWRGKGLGKTLIQELENLFRGKGFNNINTVSCAFQAPSFYVKCGFEVEFVRKNKQNSALDLTFLVKFFDDENIGK